MFKSRKFLFGLGVGLIISSMALMAMEGSIFEKNISPNINLEAEEKQWTIAELQTIAIKNNFIIYTEEEVTKLKDEYVADLLKENEIGAISEDVLDSEPDTVTNPTVDENYFTIPNGMKSFEVADYLTELGILKEKTRFIQLLYNNKLTTRIIAKNYKYSKELSTEELIELITRVKID